MTESILQRVARGDQRAVRECIDEFGGLVWAIARRMTRSRADAEDAVQETLWAATRAIKTFRGSASSIVSWMFTIVRRECFRLIDRHRRSPVPLGDEAEEASYIETVPRRGYRFVAEVRTEPSAGTSSHGVNVPGGWPYGAASCALCRYLRRRPVPVSP